MPIKIEEGQFINKITKLPYEELKEYYIELYNVLNIKALTKIVNSK